MRKKVDKLEFHKKTIQWNEWMNEWEPPKIWTLKIKFDRSLTAKTLYSSLRWWMKFQVMPNIAYWYLFDEMENKYILPTCRNGVELKTRQDALNSTSFFYLSFCLHLSDTCTTYLDTFYKDFGHIRCFHRNHLKIDTLN